MDNEAESRLSMLFRRRAAMAATEVAAQAFNVSIGALTSSARQRARVSEARQIAMYLTHVVCGLTMREVALEFDRSHATVSHACHAIEDRREGALFDREVDVLERVLRAKLRAIYALSARKPAPFETKALDICVLQVQPGRLRVAS